MSVLVSLLACAPTNINAPWSIQKTLLIMVRQEAAFGDLSRVLWVWWG